MKAVERRETERVDPADQRRIDHARLDGALRGGEHLGAGGAGRGDDHGGAGEAQGAARKSAERESVVRTAVAKLRRQRAAGAIAVAVGELGLEDSGGAGAEKDPDALAAVTRGAAAHGLGEAVFGER